MATAKKYVNKKHLLRYSLEEQLIHGMRVSNYVYLLSREMGMDDAFCYDMAVAGMLHDIGKELVSSRLDARAEQLIVEEIHYVRLHSQASYEILKKRGYSERIQQAVLYHHENMDGSGYPENLAGEAIPLGSRMIRICDVYAALTSDRPYRKAFDKQTAFQMMIEEIKDFDVKIFLAFQRVLHQYEEPELRLPESHI